jgi:TonB family protein
MVVEKTKASLGRNMKHILFAPLATPQSRWKSLLAGWGVQTFVVSVLLAFNALFPQQVHEARKYMVMHLVAPYEPTITEAQPVNPHLVVKIKPVPQPVIETPTVAKLVPPQLHKTKEPELVAPEIKVASNPGPNLPPMPKAPLANVVATNTFPQPTNVMPTTAKPAAQVQTGGFGDPNGIPATGDGKHGVNINAKGNPGLPSGPGFGNGLGGSKGTAGVGIVGNGRVQSSGFDKQAAAPVRNVEAETVTAGAPVEIISKPKPAYTEEGRRAKVEGEVLLNVLFTATGQAHVIAVLQGLGYGLDEQAARAVEQIKFNPAQHAGRRVDSTAKVRVIFELAS